MSKSRFIRLTSIYDKEMLVNLDAVSVVTIDREGRTALSLLDAPDALVPVKETMEEVQDRIVGVGGSIWG